MKNKQVKQMMWSIYCSAFGVATDNFSRYKTKPLEDKFNWAFDRVRLCEEGFRRTKLRHPEFSKVSVKGNHQEVIDLVKSWHPNKAK